MTGIDTCPHCKAHLITRRNKFRHQSRVIPVTVPEAFDGPLYWRCPDCGHCWNRWEPGTSLHALAEQHIPPPTAPDQ